MTGKKYLKTNRPYTSTSQVKAVKRLGQHQIPEAKRKYPLQQVLSDEEEASSRKPAKSSSGVITGVSAGGFNVRCSSTNQSPEKETGAELEVNDIGSNELLRGVELELLCIFIPIA